MDAPLSGWLCLRCGTVTTPDPSLKACPSCGAHGVPADVADRVAVNITWHELRVLVIWAERWASSVEGDAGADMRRIVYGIADRLQQQHFDKAGLTFASELAALRSDVGHVEQNVIKEDRP